MFRRKVAKDLVWKLLTSEIRLFQSDITFKISFFF